MAFWSCSSDRKQIPEKTTPTYEEALQNVIGSQGHKVIAMETLDAGTYTYVRFDEDGREYWAAITARPVEIGATYYYKDAMEMTNFESKQLQRNFDTVLFIQELYDHPVKNIPGTTTADPHDHKISQSLDNIIVEPVKGGISIEELFRNKNKYNGEQVIVRGQVVKINKNIMERHWIHLQDGTDYDGNFDLTVTTTDPVDFQRDEIVTFKGTIAVEKDFGSGYKYNVIMEEASRQKIH